MRKLNKIFIQQCKNYNIFKLIPFLLLPTVSKKFSIYVAINRNLFKINTDDKNNNEYKKKKSIVLNNFDNIIKKYINISHNIEKNKSFANLLRNSNLIQLGDPEGKIVIGKIFQVVKNDLYIDFGWKFHCVCTKPIKNNNKYIRDATVLLQIKDLELSTRFLGSNSDSTILEADCILLGLIYSPHKIHNVIF